MPLHPMKIYGITSLARVTFFFPRPKKVPFRFSVIAFRREPIFLSPKTSWFTLLRVSSLPHSNNSCRSIIPIKKFPLKVACVPSRPTFWETLLLQTSLFFTYLFRAAVVRSLPPDRNGIGCDSSFPVIRARVSSSFLSPSTLSARILCIQFFTLIGLTCAGLLNGSRPASLRIFSSPHFPPASIRITNRTFGVWILYPRRCRPFPQNLKFW